MRKIGKKGIYSSILDRFQNDEVFHADQLKHNWTKQWCEYLDYIRTIDTSHKASPEQLDRYATLYHFRYDPKQMERGPIKSRPDYHQTTRAIVSMNKEAGPDSRIKKTSQLPRGSGPREARLAFLALSQLEMVLRGKPNFRLKFHTIASTKISRSACLGKPRSIHWWWSMESQLVDNVLVGENKDGSGTTKSEDFFLVSGFRTHVVATTVCATGDVHTLRVARTFFWHIFPCVARGVCSAPHLSIAPLHSHVPCASFAVPARSLRDHIPVCTVFAELFPIRKRGSSTPPHERRGVWPLADSTHSTGPSGW